MTTSRANRKLENGTWRYLDQQDAEFVLFSEPEYSIEAVDDFVDGLHGVTLSDETISLLRGMRHDAFQAYVAKNIHLMEAHLRGLHMACRAAGMLDAARKGAKFKSKGRGQGPIKKRITALLKKSPSMKNAELWDEIAAKPPRGWTACDNRLGRYLEAPTGGKDCGYDRFLNIAAEVRRQMKG